MLYRSLAVLAVLFALTWPRGVDSQAESLETPSDPTQIAFFKSPHGVEQPVRLPLEKNAESDWSYLTFREYSGLRVRLAVATDDLPLDAFAGTEADIAKRLVTALEKTFRFEVDLLDEGSAETTMDLGPTASGQYEIRMSPAPSDQEDLMRMTFRIIDVSRRQVIFASTEFATVPSGAGNSDYLQALDVCINKGAYRLTKWLSRRPWAGSVVQVERGRVVINAGSRHGLEPKMKLRALSQQEIIDPESGQLLGAAARGSGVLELVTVQEQQAVARVVEGCEDLATGDRVEFVQ